MELRHPELLLTVALPLLLLSLWAARRSAVGLGRARLLGSLFARVLLVLSLGLILSDLRMVLPHDERAVVFVVDVSESVAPTTRRHMLQWTERAWASHSAGDRAGLVIFGSEARSEVPLGLSYDPGEPALGGLPRDGTAIELGLRLAVQQLAGEDSDRRIVLLSDGNGDESAAVREAMALASAGISIVTVAVDLNPSPREVLIGDVSAPATASEDEAFLLKVEVVARSGGSARIHVVRNGEYLAPLPVELAPGTNTVSLPQRLSRPDSYVYEVSVEGRGDGNVANNVGGAIVRVRGQRKVLLAMGPLLDESGSRVRSAEEVAKPLREVLTAAGFVVDVRSPDALPLGQDELAAFAAVVFGGIPADRWTLEQMEAIRQYVFAQGGGLLALGSEHSFGQGGYYRTPIEKALPVNSDVRGKKVLPSMALVFCIDRSGSMAEQSEGATRLDLAREGAARSVDLLQPFDRLGLIAFDTLPEWTVDLAHVDEPAKIKAAIRSIDMGGGTAIGPALEEARIALDRVEAEIKHVVLLTDGKSGDSEAYLTRLMREFRDGKITLTTVGVGQGVDKEYLEALATGTDGRFLYAPDAQTLPRLLTQEAVTASRALLIEREVQARHVGGLNDLGLEWESAPPLLGFVMTVAKDEVEVVLDSGPEDTAEDGPLLVRWRYGLGKSAAFTSDATARWCKRWLRWPGFGTLLPAIVGWVARSPEAPGLTTSLTLERGAGLVRVRATNPEGQAVNGLDLHANPVGPPAAGALARHRLQQVAPGTYESRFQTSQPGAYFVTVEAEQDGRPTPVGSAGGVVAYPREYRHLSHDPGLLRRLADITRGEALTLDHPPERVFVGARSGQRSFRPLSPYLFVVAACLLLIEVGLRRLILPRGWLNLRSPPEAEPGLARKGSARLLSELRSHKESEREAAAVRRQRAEIAQDFAEKRSTPAPPPAASTLPPPKPPKRKPSETSSGSMAKLLDAKRKARKRDDQGDG